MMRVAMVPEAWMPRGAVPGDRNPPRSHVAAVCYRPAFAAASFSTLRMSIFAIMMSEAETMPITHG